MRYRTLTELLGRSPGERSVRAARKEILRHGWAAEILAERTPGKGWADGTSLYRPKYTSTHWKMMVLSDLGVTREETPVREACEYWMDGFAANGGGLGGNSKGTPHYCVAANMARALIRFGYEDDSRVRQTLDWLVETADPRGGWSCFGSGRNLDSWEALSAFAELPRSKWTAGQRECVARAAEFYLERELCRQGARYDPWFRFHYPVHYYYDLLVGLGFMTALGYGRDPRLTRALSVLKEKQRPDGRWNLDGIHPDVRGPLDRWLRTHPGQQPIPWGLETPGEPSKMFTFLALQVVSRTAAHVRRPAGVNDGRKGSGSRSPARRR